MSSDIFNVGFTLLLSHKAGNCLSSLCHQLLHWFSGGFPCQCLSMIHFFFPWKSSCLHPLSFFVLFFLFFFMVQVTEDWLTRWWTFCIWCVYITINSKIYAIYRFVVYYKKYIYLNKDEYLWNQIFRFFTFIIILDHFDMNKSFSVDQWKKMKSTVIECWKSKEGWTHMYRCSGCEVLCVVFAGTASCCAVWTVARVLWQDLPSSLSWASWHMSRMCQ